MGWSSNNELYTCGDDKIINRWSGEGEKLGEVPYIDDGYATDIHWLPLQPGKTKQNAAEVYAIGSTDGKYFLISRGGRPEKVVEAHKGALLCLRWNYEGSALLTSGEDGSAKIWSRSGLLRSVLVQTSNPVYCVAWGPDGDKILVTSGRNLIIKPSQPSAKETMWKAHEGAVLKVDWNPINNLIISGGEDKRYKVWDSFGRWLYSSAVHDHIITSLAWSPNGETFAVGSFNTIRICDKIGWSYAMSKPETGSVFAIAWTPDGTQFAFGGGNGAMVFAHLVEQRLEWKNLEVILIDDSKIIVKDVTTDLNEVLEFRDHVIKCSLGFRHLIVATSNQCYVYSEKNFNTPSIIDLNTAGRVSCILQSDNCFCIVDNIIGIQIYSYEGRLFCNPKYAGLRPEYLNSQTMSLSDDSLAIKDRANEKLIYVFDVTNGRQLPDPIQHSLEIAEIALDQFGAAQTRQLILVDKNRDMYITSVIKPSLRKMGSMVETFMWNDESNMVAAIQDGKFTVWYYPNVVFIDEDIAQMTKFEKDGSEFGKNAQFVNFQGTQCLVRRADGALVHASRVQPYPILLHQLVRKKQWEGALRLCRYAKNTELWACLAAMSIQGQDLNTAEVAYAAIEEIDKVQYICYVKELSNGEARNAELALFRRQPVEAEKILLQAGQTYRAIKIHITLYNWEKALELAIKYKTHIDTVLYLRELYLKSFGRKEMNKKFIQFGQGVEIDPEKIKAKIELEERKYNK